MNSINHVLAPIIIYSDCETDDDDSCSNVSELDVLDEKVLDFDGSASMVEIDMIEKMCRDDYSWREGNDSKHWLAR